MIIKEYGNSSLPKVVLLHPMLASGQSMLKIAETMEGHYCFIAPDFSGQGEDESEFVSAKSEAEMLNTYLQSQGYFDIVLMFGASLGARIGLEMLTDSRIHYQTIVFEGAPLYKNAKLLYYMMSFVFLKKQKKAKKHPGLSQQKMSEIYGIFGESMGHSFEKMSSQSLKNIIKACSDFHFPQYSQDLQKRMFFEFGSQDKDAKQKNVILKEYPYVHVYLREGYGHCEYMARHYQEYGKVLENYMREGK